ncbi:nucleotide exchange factor GrpE [Patescibacteria group bacterium]|nr:nucleotide exchange factor GrpE [Patescibacteria group bacterium]
MDTTQKSDPKGQGAKKTSKNDQEISALTQEVKDLKEKLARALADYSNLEKRIDSQRQLIATLTVTAIVNQFIGVLDDLYLVNDHLRDEGLKITVEKFATTLKAQGVIEIDALGKEFDPATMECIDVKEGPVNQVLEVSKKGYQLNGQMIRPAQVVVGKTLSN